MVFIGPWGPWASSIASSFGMSLLAWAQAPWSANGPLPMREPCANYARTMRDLLRRRPRGAAAEAAFSFNQYEILYRIPIKTLLKLCKNK